MTSRKFNSGAKNFFGSTELINIFSFISEKGMAASESRMLNSAQTKLATPLIV